MTIAVPIALFGWPLVVLGLFAALPTRRAVIAAFLFAWLFLPMASYAIEGLPNYTKTSATSYAVLLGVLLFDSARMMRLRPSWVDLPMAVWCVVPLATSLTNGLGAYDGVSSVVGQVVAWGVPWFIGRLYFSDLDGLRELAIGIFIGGLVYVPLCLYEIRMSPQLHDMVYGYHQHSFAQTKRFGGWRPTVFMQHGLAVGFWMASASLAGVWLWRSGVLRHIRGVSMSILVPMLVATTILCKSAGALALLAGGAGVLFATRWTRSPVWLALLIAAPVGYMAVRSTGEWSGRPLIAIAEMISDERAGSLQMRLDNEDLLAEKAWDRPAFGWGAWGRNRVYDEQGRDLTTTDGLWIITFGQRGLIGLAALYLMLLLPAVLMVTQLPAAAWSSIDGAPAAAVAVLLVLFVCDSLFNAMPNPLYVLAAGGLGGLFVDSRLHATLPPRSNQGATYVRSRAIPFAG